MLKFKDFDKNNFENGDIVLNIKVTKDYDKFKFLGENRLVNQKHVAKLINSMRQQLLCIPIIVNKDFEIIDGQHRFHAVREIGEPVFYFMIEDYGITEVQMANSNTSSWNDLDRLRSFIETGKEEYIKIKDVMDKFNMPLNSILNIFAQVQGHSINAIKYRFKNGMFVTDGLDEVEEFFTEIQMFDFFKGYNARAFVSAFVELYFHEKYDSNTMSRKVELRKEEFRKMRSKYTYLDFLCNRIYSHGMKDGSKNAIYYHLGTKKFFGN